MKNQKVFSLVMFVVLATVGCAVPMAYVETYQELPRATPQGCSYPEKTGDSRSGHVSATGLVFDPAALVIAAAWSNATVTQSCADLDMVHSVTGLYGTYEKNVLQASADDGSGLKQELKDTKAAVGKVVENVAALPETIVAGVEEALANSNQSASGKKGKGNKVQATIAPLASQPSINIAPPPFARPATNGPSFAARVSSAQTRSELANIAKEQAQLDPTNAQRLNNSANAIGNGSGSDLTHDKQMLIENFGQ